MRARRWSDDDTYFGPFTFAKQDWKHWAVLLSSADDEGYGCNLRITLYGWTFITALPNILPPHKAKVTARYWSAQDIERVGRDWYWSVTKRVYGFSLQGGHFDLRFGRETHDSGTEQRWGCFLPWTQWRHVRHSLYGLDGSHVWTESDHLDFDAWFRAKEACPSVTFSFADFDGQKIEAKTHIEEREWRLGVGKFKWLSLFRKPRISRSLDISFSEETGERKGSWKGGTLGHSIEMLPGELHEAAFRRYCAAHKMTFEGVVA